MIFDDSTIQNGRFNRLKWGCWPPVIQRGHIKRIDGAWIVYWCTELKHYVVIFHSKVLVYQRHQFFFGWGLLIFACFFFWFFFRFEAFTTFGLKIEAPTGSNTPRNSFLQKTWRVSMCRWAAWWPLSVPPRIMTCPTNPDFRDLGTWMRLIFGKSRFFFV